MLRSLRITEYKPSKKKCGEIFCDNLEDYSISCSVCEIKFFDFAEFMFHFRNVHLIKEEREDYNIISQAEGSTKRKSLPHNKKTEPATNLEASTSFEEEEELPLDVLLKSNNDSSSEFVDAAEALVKQDSENEYEYLLADETDTEQNNDNYVPDSKSAEEEMEAIYDDNEEYVPTIKKMKDKCHKLDEPLLPCHECGRVFKTMTTLKVHQQKFHTLPQEGRAKCLECGKAFITYTQMEHHAREQHGGVKCFHCGKCFNTFNNYRRHIPIHNPERAFHCTLANCKRSFQSELQLKAHLRWHEVKRDFVCDICGYACQREGVLLQHVRSHRKEKPFKCDICHKCFGSQSLVNEHKQAHSVDRPYKCDVCGKTFNRSKALYHHKPLHLPEKKFKCKLCHNAYSQAAGLAAHMRKHRTGAFADDGLQPLRFNA